MNVSPFNQMSFCSSEIRRFANRMAATVQNLSKNKKNKKKSAKIRIRLHRLLLLLLKPRFIVSGLLLQQRELTSIRKRREFSKAISTINGGG